MYTLFVKKRNTFYLYRKQTAKNMQVITAKDLRADQKKYFDLEENEIIFVVRREACPIKISVATEEENLINTDSCAWYFSLWDMCFALKSKEAVQDHISTDIQRGFVLDTAKVVDVVFLQSYKKEKL